VKNLAGEHGTVRSYAVSSNGAYIDARASLRFKSPNTMYGVLAGKFQAASKVGREISGRDTHRREKCHWPSPGLADHMYAEVM
jgi:hypothetical protein